MEKQALETKKYASKKLMGHLKKNIGSHKIFWDKWKKKKKKPTNFQNLYRMQQKKIKEERL